MINIVFTIGYMLMLRVKTLIIKVKLIRILRVKLLMLEFKRTIICMMNILKEKRDLKLFRKDGDIS